MKKRSERSIVGRFEEKAAGQVQPTKGTPMMPRSVRREVELANYRAGKTTEKIRYIGKPMQMNRKSRRKVGVAYRRTLGIYASGAWVVELGHKIRQFVLGVGPKGEQPIAKPTTIPGTHGCRIVWTFDSFLMTLEEQAKFLAGGGKLEDLRRHIAERTEGAVQ